MTSAAGDDWLKQRQDFLAQAGFSLAFEALTRGGEIKRVTITLGDLEETMVLDDEYQDLDRHIPALSLEVLIRAAADTMGAASAAEYCKAITYSGTLTPDEWASQQAAAQAITRVCAPFLSDVSDLDWQLSAGRAQQLRSLS